MQKLNTTFMKKLLPTKQLFKSPAFNITVIIVLVVCLNLLVVPLKFRLDLTRDQLFSLAKGSENILANINTPVTMKFYFSESQTNVPIFYKNFGQKVGELLEEYAYSQRQYLKLEQFDPKPDSDEEEWADRYGLNGIEVGTGERFYLGLVLLAGEKELPIPFFDPRREHLLEYEITQAILQTTTQKTDLVGIMSSVVLGLAGSQNPGQPAPQKWALVSELEKQFELVNIPTTAEEIPASVSTLIIIHPKNLSEKTLYAIDQFLMRNGDLAIFVDPHMRVDLEALRQAQIGLPVVRSSNLQKLFEHWGINYDPNLVLGDLQRPTTVNTAAGASIPFSLWHSINKDAFNSDLLITNNLETMLLPEPGGFKLNADSPLQGTVLIQSTKQSGFVNQELLSYSEPAIVNQLVKPANEQHWISGLLIGDLQSAFTANSATIKEQHLTQTEVPARILLTTDVDFLADNFAVQRTELFGQQLLQLRNDNLIFFTNLVEFLRGAEDLMFIRSRGRFQRPFTKIEELEAQANLEYYNAEQELQLQLSEIQTALSELEVDDGSTEITLSKETLEQIRQFKELEHQTRQDLRNTRKLLRQEIEMLQNWLVFFNLVTLPFLITLVGIFIYTKRTRKH